MINNKRVRYIKSGKKKGKKFIKKGRNVDSIISWGITGHLQNKSKVRQMSIEKQGHYTIFNRSEQADMKKHIVYIKTVEPPGLAAHRDVMLQCLIRMVRISIFLSPSLPT